MTHHAQLSLQGRAHGVALKWWYLKHFFGGIVVEAAGLLGRGDPLKVGKSNYRCGAKRGSDMGLSVVLRKHGGRVHNLIIKRRVAALLRNRAKRLVKVGAVQFPEVNGEQKDVSGKIITSCRPDIQYSWAGGKRRQLEEVSDTSPLYKELGKTIVMLAADLDAGWILIRQFGGRR